MAGRACRDDTCEVTGLNLRIAWFMAATWSLMVPLLATWSAMVGKTKLETNHWAVVRLLGVSKREEAPWVIILVWVE